MKLTRRTLLQSTAASVALAGASLPSFAAGIEELVIAYNVNLPSWDPTVGPSAVNPTIQGIYQSVFDLFIPQNPDLSFGSGIITDYGWNDDKTKVWMDVREGVTWHNGDPLTPEDVVWSLERAGNPETGNPIQFIWGKIGNFSIEGNRVTADVLAYEPTIFKWMSFLTGYILPKKYYEEVGADGFEAAPVGTGPYMVEKFERNAFVRLKANENYWGGAPEFKSVTIKFVTDAASRVAEVESGNAHVTLEMPYEEFDRLKEKSGIMGTAAPVSDIGMIFINDIEVMTDPNVRMAMAHAIDKQLIIDRLLSGYGVAIDTLQTPDYVGYDETIKVAYDPEKSKELLAASGYGPDNPVKFTIQTTRGFKPKDYEIIQAIVGLWRRVGIEAEIEVYEIAKHYELRAADTLAPAAFYNWGNSIGDPTTSTGFAMFGPSPHSVWDGEELMQKILPLWGESDEDKRIAGWKDVDRFIAENALVIPLLQYVQPILHSDQVKVVPHASGALLPHLMTRA
ncbi:ABC transporter substrate-binding protein [Phaeobacter gallaeciensis]|jgi:peptide/nickel transport system substrate-binding protein|uniref:ABC transporter substrate-binding protein n=1 Tax=Rhodobacterales TaxID=204455 RepID=UPI00237F1A5A|nr:ABC transporter substrate-binding protein [Phaeobacter gallaeciensis]MDE4097893.1 ABC transporter substrate-binding protein [Phaeobacter gallaeciensis]MDE4106848.1 ABC transporter substrate-binding protein [Phaeobacter gallaeciensis]MDE4111302.1 ABC transporter substrate-binding protein [Phaeobacter gallaeciensis]MDE4115628.1 ABC transporter substrate-binding protein [Phaeobacter gallaeciensis]MDE4120243.1 ABC transporter substrate-binding protein [Phaeobacter gallaeciensis]